jgi:lysophospholipase L1-like esterase
LRPPQVWKPKRSWLYSRRRRSIVPSGPTPLVFDQFAGANGDAITAHTIAPTNTPATAWTNYTNTHTIQDNAARPGTNGTFNTSMCNPGVADGIFAVVLNGSDTANHAGVVARGTDGNNHWFFSRGNTGSRAFLFRVESGGYNSVGQIDYQWVAGTEYAIITSGTSIKAYINAILALSVTSSFNQSATLAGVSSVSTNNRLDNFAAATTAGVPNSGLNHVCFCGDSITAGTAVISLPYPNQTLGQLYSNPIMYARGENLGISGQRASGIEATQGAAADAAYSATYKRNALVLLIGTNDLDDGTAAATVEGYISSFCAARRAAGYGKIIVCTITPRSDVSWSAANETQRLALNAIITSGYAAYADACVDLANATGLTNAADAAIYPDGLHLSTAGNTLAASAVASVLNTLL